MPRATRLTETSIARELFWQNVIREMLTSLSVECLNRPHRPVGEDEDLFDGRLAIITRDGERIAIADVFPLFACGVPSAEALSVEVECTVFQIRTPEGEVYTLPLQEIRAFHSLSEDLVRRLKEASERQLLAEPSHPFGYAAFTSLAKREHPGDEPAI